MGYDGSVSYGADINAHETALVDYFLRREVF